MSGSAMRSGPTGAVLLGIGVVVALLVVWRILAVGLDELFRPDTTRKRMIEPLERVDPDARLRERIARNPTNARAVLSLGLELEAQGKNAQATALMAQAMRLDPADPWVLLSTGRYYLRSGDELQGLRVMRRAVDLYPTVGDDVWPKFTASLEAGRQNDYFRGLAGENPSWWRDFFRHLCADAEDTAAVRNVFGARVEANVVTDKERACMLSRLQREGRWADARQLWMDSLPPEQRRQVGNVFNGDFERPISNLGFDWIVASREGTTVETQPIEGARGRKALQVAFANKRYDGPPIYQNLMLAPGRYRLQGMGRSDALETWLGLQWGVYCLTENGADAQQLVKTERFLRSSDWTDFAQDFVVPRGCTLQTLRLELANPRRDATTPGSVTVRLRGSLWFDDLKIVSLD